MDLIETVTYDAKQHNQRDDVKALVEAADALLQMAEDVQTDLGAAPFHGLMAIRDARTAILRARQEPLVIGRFDYD